MQSCWKSAQHSAAGEDSAVGLFSSHWVCPFAEYCTALGLWSRDKWLIVTLLNVLIEMCVCLPSSAFQRTIFVLLLLRWQAQLKSPLSLHWQGKSDLHLGRLFSSSLTASADKSLTVRRSRLTDDCILRETAMPVSLALSMKWSDTKPESLPAAEAQPRRRLERNNLNWLMQIQDQIVLTPHNRNSAAAAIYHLPFILFVLQPPGTTREHYRRVLQERATVNCRLWTVSVCRTVEKAKKMK